MGLQEFFQEREKQWDALEKRCRELYAQHGSKHSYSTTEINMLRALKLIPPKKD